MTDYFDINSFPVTSKVIKESKSELLCLYFAASWCPDCTPVTASLKELYEKQDMNKKLFEILYVSSDSSAEQMAKSAESSFGSWSVIPFLNVEERTNLKTHFKAYAGKEASVLGLGMVGRNGIPYVVVINCKTYQVTHSGEVTSGDIHLSSNIFSSRR